MRRPTYLIALLLLCIQQGCIGGPVETNKGVQSEYSYLGYIDTRSSACDERLARSSISGNLTIQTYDDYWIFQLSNLKTSLFNGPKADISLSHEEDAPKEAEVLTLPFIFNRLSQIIVDAKDLPWSVNFKRGIASHFQEFKEEDVFQKTVFGDCETSYDMKDKNNVIKTINHESCKDTPDKLEANIRKISFDFKDIRRETVVNYKPDPENDDILRSIHSVSKLSHQHMHKSPNSQHIDQHLELDLISSSTKFDRINTDKLTEKKSIIFEYVDEWSNGRHVYDDADILIEEYFQYYEKFEKYFDAIPIKNHINDTDDPIEHMFYFLIEMPTVNDLVQLHDKIQNTANRKMYSTFMSLLPYVGTNNTIKFIHDLVVKGDFDTDPYQSVKLLATFPEYIKNPTDELVESLEVLLNVANIKSDFIKNSQILSFSSVVAKAYKEDSISEENLNKYIKLYYDTYLGSDIYEEKMVYLMGLVAMGQGLKNQFIMDIITDSSQPANLRSLAITGFKSRLLRSNPIRIFSILWPVVQNKTENFDLRVQALDYILDSGASDREFQIAFDRFKDYQIDDIHGQHLANYFLTAIESNQNSTSFSYDLEDFATAVLKNEHFPIFTRPWTTGNYRLTYRDTDPNMGGYFQTKLIANPVLNTISTIQLTTNKFAFSFATGEYTIYLKLQGVMELLYKNNFFKHVTEETSVPELLNIIKEFGFELKKRTQDFHVEVVVFVNDKAVFATSIDSNKREDLETKWKHFVQIFDSLGENTLTISFPIMHFTRLTSVLGTPISINSYMQQITNYGFPKNDLVYRSSWNFQTWLEAYNPLVDTSIGSYKYYGNEIGVQTKASINLKNFGAGWVVKNDSFNRVWDNIIGTAVEHKYILKKYCPDCDATHEIPTDLYTFNRINDLSNLGMNVNSTVQTNDEDYYKRSEMETFKEFLSTHQSNANAFPFAKPFLVLLNYVQYKDFFKKELQRGSTRSIPLDEDGVQTLVKFDFDIKSFENTASPFIDIHNNFSLNVFNKKLNEDEEDLNNWMLLLEFKSNHNHKDEHGNDKVMLTQNIYLHEYETNENETGANICVSRVELLPPVRSDRFSLLPVEETTATTIIQHDDTPPHYSDFICSDNNTITLTESFITTDEINKKVKESEDYKECQKDSVGLYFVPPTTACMASFLASSQYNHHIIDAKIKNVNIIDSTDLDKNHLFEATRVDNSKIEYKLFTSPFTEGIPTDKYFKYTTYYPFHTKNPVADVYRESCSFKRSCIVTSKKVRTFTGHNIPIDEKNNVAFVECIDRPVRGLKFKKIDDTHVGFRFWSRDHIVDTTVNGDKIKIALNGNELSESHVSEDKRFSVEFLDKNVVLIADDKIYIYYNTEYIYIKANPIYSDLICGVCSEV